MYLPNNLLQWIFYFFFFCNSPTGNFFLTVLLTVDAKKNLPGMFVTVSVDFIALTVEVGIFRQVATFYNHFLTYKVSIFPISWQLEGFGLCHLIFVCHVLKKYSLKMCNLNGKLCCVHSYFQGCQQLCHKRWICFSNPFYAFFISCASNCEGHCTENIVKEQEP